MQNITKAHFRTYVKILSMQSEVCEVGWRLDVEDINVSVRGNYRQLPRIGGKAKSWLSRKTDVTTVECHSLIHCHSLTRGYLAASASVAQRDSMSVPHIFIFIFVILFETSTASMSHALHRSLVGCQIGQLIFSFRYLSLSLNRIKDIYGELKTNKIGEYHVC